MTLRLAYYGDDFTGSTDALEFLTRAGIRTVLFTAPPTPSQLARFSNLGAVGVAGFTRSLAPAEMERELRPAFTALRTLGAAHIHYKVCSTFDSSPTLGSIGRAIDVGTEIFGGAFVPLVVGAPPLGRYCAFGNLFARFGIGSAGAIHRLDRHPAMSRHPSTPMDEADLAVHLSRQTTKRVALFDFLTLARSEPARRAALDRLVADGAQVVLFDVLENSHLSRIGALLNSFGTPERPLFSVGSSAIEMALGAQWNAEAPLPSRSAWNDPGSSTPLLVISGSCSPVTLGQIRWALREGFMEVGIKATAPHEQVASVVQAAVAHARAGRHVIVHSHDADFAAGNELVARLGRDAPPTVQSRESVSSFALGNALAKIARDVIAAANVKRLLVAGGDTSSHAARALGIEAVEMIAPLAPGAPLCRAFAPRSSADGIEINFKGGQVGAENYFGAVAAGKV